MFNPEKQEPESGNASSFTPLNLLWIRASLDIKKYILTIESEQPDKPGVGQKSAKQQQESSSMDDQEMLRKFSEMRTAASESSRKSQEFEEVFQYIESRAKEDAEVSFSIGMIFYEEKSYWFAFRYFKQAKEKNHQEAEIYYQKVSELVTVEHDSVQKNDDIKITEKQESPIMDDQEERTHQANAAATDAADLTTRGTPRIRRPKRSRDELNGNPKSEANRYTVKLGGTVPRELRDQFVACVKAQGITQTEALTEAVEAYLKEHCPS